MTSTQFISECSANAIQKAAELLKAGHLVAFPTETVYGLGADATKEHAISRVYEVKGRPTNHPLIVHVSSINALGVWARDIPDYAVDLARTFWPGPMTLILNRTELAQDFITGGQNSVGIRIPSNPFALELLSHFESLGGLGIAAPSANRFGKVSPTSAGDVEEEIGMYLAEGDLILDGGRSTIGIESTIIDCRNIVPCILRPGAVTDVMINSIVRLEKKSHERDNLRVSGELINHYSPKAKVILDRIPEAGQAFIAMSQIETPSGVFRIASPNTVEEFVYDLYSSLRKVDALFYKEVVINTPDKSGIGIAANDRLLRAAFKDNF
jgi:L-threonylcarbamoyladenylate synthase